MHHDGMHYYPIGRGPCGYQTRLLVDNHEYTDKSFLQIPAQEAALRVRFPRGPPPTSARSPGGSAPAPCASAQSSASGLGRTLDPGVGAGHQEVGPQLLTDLQQRHQHDQDRDRPAPTPWGPADR